MDNRITSADSGQSAKRDHYGRFTKGGKPMNGFDKNPQNIAPGGYWRYKEHGKAAILDIFKMSMSDFHQLETMAEADKTVLDELLFAKFKSAINGNSKDAEFLFNQAFGVAPTYKEAQFEHYRLFEKQRAESFDRLTREDIEAILGIVEAHQTPTQN